METQIQMQMARRIMAIGCEINSIHMDCVFAIQ